MNRRDFVRRGSLWLAAATVIDPDMVGWTRRLWPGANMYRYATGTMIRFPHMGESFMPKTVYMSNVPIDIVQAYQRQGFLWQDGIFSTTGMLRTPHIIIESRTKLCGHLTQEFDAGPIAPTSFRQRHYV